MVKHCLISFIQPHGMGGTVLGLPCVPHQAIWPWSCPATALQYIDTLYGVPIYSGQPPAPFCELLESTSPTSLSCTADHEAVSRCNRVGFVEDLPDEFQVSQASYSQPSWHADRLGITMLYVFSVLLRSTIRWACHFHRLLSYSRCEV